VVEIVAVTDSVRNSGDARAAVEVPAARGTRCAKHMLHGPCGGSTSERCEVSADKPCAWQSAAALSALPVCG
jgi:hypothetical protein